MKKKIDIIWGYLKKYHKNDFEFFIDCCECSDKVGHLLYKDDHLYLILNITPTSTYILYPLSLRGIDIEQAYKEGVYHLYINDILEDYNNGIIDCSYFLIVEDISNYKEIKDFYISKSKDYFASGKEKKKGKFRYHFEECYLSSIPNLVDYKKVVFNVIK